MAFSEGQQQRAGPASPPYSYKLPKRRARLSRPMWWAQVAERPVLERPYRAWARSSAVAGACWPRWS